MNKVDEHADVVIIGGGVAGLSCALYTAKAGLATVVIDADASQLQTVKQLNNLPGLSAPSAQLGGSEWLLYARSQASDAGAKIHSDRATMLSWDTRPFHVATERGFECTSEFAVLAVNLGYPWLTELGFDVAVNEHVPSGKIRYVVGAGYDGVTSVDGLYVAGLLAHIPSQSIISAGQGAFVGVQIASRHLGRPYMWHD